MTGKKELQDLGVVPCKSVVATGLKDRYIHFILILSW